MSGRGRAYAWDDMDHVNGVKKSPIIVYDELSLTKLKMFQIIKDRDAIKILVTNDMDEAKAWIDS